MPAFIQTLLGIIMSLVVSLNHGSASSLQALHLPNLSHLNVSTSLASSFDQDDATHSATASPKPRNHPDTDRVAAYNSKSGKNMPTTIPVVALEHSHALKAGSVATDSGSVKKEDNDDQEEVESSENTSVHGLGSSVSINAKSHAHTR